MENQLPDIFPEPEIERVSMKRIGASILAILNLERGLFYTLWTLLKSPGESMRTYLFVDRARFLDPMKLLILSVALYLFFTFNFAPDTGFVAGFKEGLDASASDAEKIKFSEKVIAAFTEHANLILLLSVPVAAMVSRWFFRPFRLLYTEHLVLNAYLYGFLSFVGILLVPLSIVNPLASNLLIAIISLVYSIYFFKKFFQISWGKSILKSTSIYITAQLLYMILLTIVLMAIMIIEFI